MQVLEQGAMTARGVMLYDVPPLYDLIVRPSPCEAFCRELANRAGGPILNSPAARATSRFRSPRVGTRLYAFYLSRAAMRDCVPLAISTA